MDAESSQPVIRNPITSQTALSIGVVVVLVTASLALLREVYGVRTEITPQLAEIRARLESVVERVTDISRKLEMLPTQAAIDARLQGMEQRIRELDERTRGK